MLLRRQSNLSSETHHSTARLNRISTTAVARSNIQISLSPLHPGNYADARSVLYCLLIVTKLGFVDSTKWRECSNTQLQMFDQFDRSNSKTDIWYQHGPHKSMTVLRCPEWDYCKKQLGTQQISCRLLCSPQLQLKPKVVFSLSNNTLWQVQLTSALLMRRDSCIFHQYYLGRLAQTTLAIWLILYIYQIKFGKSP